MSLKEWKNYFKCWYCSTAEHFQASYNTWKREQKNKSGLESNDIDKMMIALLEKGNPKNDCILTVFHRVNQVDLIAEAEFGVALAPRTL